MPEAAPNAQAPSGGYRRRVRHPRRIRDPSAVTRTASIKLSPTPEQEERLFALRREYAAACNSLVPVVRKNRTWNRVELHHLAYRFLRETTPLKSQQCCNVLFSVCKAYKSQQKLGRIGRYVPTVRFNQAAVHYDHRTCHLRVEQNEVVLTTLGKTMAVGLALGEQQRRLLEAGSVREAELVYKKRNREWYFNVVVESQAEEPVLDGPTMGVDVGENNLAAISTGRLFGGGRLRHERDQHLALRARLQSNGSRSAIQMLQRISGKENRHVTCVNHVTSKAIVAEARMIGVKRIVLEDLTHIRDRIKAGLRVRTRLHRWSFRQLQTFVAYKAKALGIEVLTVNPAYTSQTCSGCGCLGKRTRHRFTCTHCGLQAHSDLNASRNLARIGRTAVPPRGPLVNGPNVEDTTGITLPRTSHDKASHFSGG